jgi:hypothetical protein
MRWLVFLNLLFVVTMQLAHADDWITVHVDEGRFTASFPSDPVSESLEIDTVFGRVTLTVNAVNAGKTAFFAGYYDIPENVGLSEAELLDAERDRGLKGASASLLRDEPFSTAGYSGRLIVAERAQLRVRARNFIIGQRLYSVMVVSQIRTDSETTANKFFESFSVWLPEEGSK